MDKSDLIELKESIDETKSEINRLEGRKEHLMQQLKDDWKCKTLAQAKKKLEKLKKDAEEVEQKIQEGITELEEKYELE